MPIIQSSDFAMSSMDSETPFTTLAPPVFNGENYHIWADIMEAYLEANDLWEAVKQDYKIPTLPENPTMDQLRNHERKAKNVKGKGFFICYYFFKNLHQDHDLEINI